VDKSASGDVKPVSNVQAQAATITAQVVVRDKHGNVKYEGPLVMDVVKDERKDNGSNS
jgi:hypothetical protein